MTFLIEKSAELFKNTPELSHARSGGVLVSARHGTSLAGESPVTGIYRQV